MEPLSIPNVGTTICPDSTREKYMKSSMSLRATTIVAALFAATLATAQDGTRSGDYRLGPGDSIKVQVYQSPDLALEARVSESGVINYPLVGRINIGGLTVPDAESRIAQALRKH